MNRVLVLQRSERGAILVHVAVILLVLAAFATFTFDFGMFWVSRRQAQNSADAAALSGAIAMAYDGADASADSFARDSAYTVSQDNLVWGEGPAVDPATDITFPVCPDGTSSCIRVDVFRDGAHGNPIPMFFGRIVGLTTQGVRATATAESMTGNATDCLKPWALIDRWTQHWENNKANNGPWTNNSIFDKYKSNGTLDPKVTTPDVYTAPSAGSPGSGFAPVDASGKPTADYGLQLKLKNGSAGLFDAGNFQALDLKCPGGACYADAIKSCVGITEVIGNAVTLETGDLTGPTNSATYTDNDSLCKQDPGAYWDSSLNNGHGGVAGSKYGSSPRLVAIPLISPDDLNLAKNGKATGVPILNIMGMFIECPPVVNPGPKEVIGRLTLMPGTKVSGGGTVGTQSSFLKVIALVR